MNNGEVIRTTVIATFAVNFSYLRNSPFIYPPVDPPTCEDPPTPIDPPTPPTPEDPPTPIDPPTPEDPPEDPPTPTFIYPPVDPPTCEDPPTPIDPPLLVFTPPTPEDPPSPPIDPPTVKMILNYFLAIEPSFKFKISSSYWCNQKLKNSKMAKSKFTAVNLKVSS